MLGRPACARRPLPACPGRRRPLTFHQRLEDDGVQLLGALLLEVIHREQVRVGGNVLQLGQQDTEGGPAGRTRGGGGGPARRPRAGASTGLRGNRPGAVGGKAARRPPPGPAPPGNGGRPPDWSWCLGCPYQLRPAHDVLPGEMLAGELLLTLLLHQPGRQEAGLAHHGRQHVGDAARARQHQPGRRMCHGPGNPLGPQGGSAGRTSAPGASWVPGAPAPPPPRARRRGARRGPQLAARHSQAPLPPRLPPGCRGHH